jgi:hypothetical protein
MIAKPDLIMLDEPSEGIMPVLVDEMFELFRTMKAQRASSGSSSSVLCRLVFSSMCSTRGRGCAWRGPSQEPLIRRVPAFPLRWVVLEQGAAAILV